MAEKQNLNIIFVGHVDHGKSTAVGRLLYDSGKLSEQELAKAKDIAEKLDVLKKAKESDSVEEIQRATEELSQVIQKAGAAMYKDQK